MDDTLFPIGNLLLFLLAMVDQAVDLLDQVAELQLLSTQVRLQSVEAIHHVIELSIVLLVLALLAAVKHAEFALELLLDGKGVGTNLALLLSVYFDEVRQLGALLTLANLDHDAHDNVFEAIFTEGHRIGAVHGLGQAHHVVARELAFLLQYLVLVNQQVASKRLVLILFYQLLYLAVRQLEQFHICLAPEIQIRLVLHEEGAMVDRGSLVKRFKHKLFVLKLGEDFNHAVLNEGERVGGLLLCEHGLVLLEVLGLKAEHKVVKHLILVLMQILHPLDHAKNKFNLLVAVLLNQIILEADLVLGELRDDFSEAGAGNTGKRVVVARDHGGAALALVDEGDFTEVISFVELAHFVLTPVVVSHLDFAVAGADKEHTRLILQVVILVVLLDHFLIGEVQGVSELNHDRVDQLLGSLLGVWGNGGVSRRKRERTPRHISCRVLLNHILSLLQDLVMHLEYTFEHVTSDAQGETWRDLLEEASQLILLRHGLHNGLEVLSNIFPEGLGQMHVLHGSVRSVDNLLLLGGLAAHLCNQDSQLTEDVGLENGTSQVDDYHKDELLQFLGAHLVTANDQHGVVKAHQIEEKLLVTLVVLDPVGVVSIVVVIGRDPGLVPIILLRKLVGLLNEEEPETGDQVEINDEEHVIVEHLEHTLGALLHVRLRDEGRDTQHAINFEDSNNTQDWAAGRRVVQQGDNIDPKAD